MRVVVQRAEKVCVSASENGLMKIRGRIGKGLVVLLGVEDEDGDEDIDYLVRKIVNMRIFNDSEGKMNLSVKDVKGGIAVVSQFTLHANTKKGNRPSFIRAARPQHAEEMYDRFIQKIKGECPDVICGVFGAYMKVDFVNEGPVTIIVDSKNREF